MRTMSAGEARRALASMERDSKPSTGVGTWIKRVLILAAVVGLLTLVWGWAMGWFSTPARVLEVRAVIDQQIADLDKVSTGQAPYAGGPDMGKVFGTMRDLPEGMRDQVRRDIGRLMEASERAQVNSFFNLPPAQRQAELDRRIKAEDDRRNQFMAERAKRASGGDRPQGERPQGGGAPDARRGGGGGGGGGGGPGGRGGPGGQGGGGTRRGFSEEDRNNRRKAGLDRTDPGQRARRTEYRRQMEERRQQLGGGGSRPGGR